MLAALVVSTRDSMDGYTREIETRLSVLPDVRGVNRSMSDGRSVDWTLLCAGTATTLDETLAILRGYNVPVETARVIEPTLEDAFLAIAGRSFE